MEDKYIAQAKTQKEAIEKGLKKLGITEEQAEITINEPGKKGFLGFGQKDALVTVVRKHKGSVLDMVVDDELEQADSSNEPEKQKRGVFNPDDYKIEGDGRDPKPAAEVFPVEEDDNSEEVSAEGSAEARKNSSEEQSAVVVDETEKVEDTQESESVERSESIETQETESKDQELTTFEKDQAAMENVRQYLEDIIHGMQVEDGKVYTSRVDKNVKYDIETENAGLVIGKHGKVLNALQTLTQNQLLQQADSKLFAKVDAENYRERRKDTVESLAKKTAKRAIETGKPVVLDPMPAHERKQIHRHLYKESGIKTHSKGKEPKRYLIIEPIEDTFADEE